MAGGFSAFAPGKVILLGEHAVVHGYPALAGPISLGVHAHARAAPRCTLQIPREVPSAARKAIAVAFERAAAVTGHPRVRVALESQLPLSMGLGSSAALSVAASSVLLQASGKRASVSAITRTALEMEKAFHGTPSGVDHTCSAMRALIRYVRPAGQALGTAREVKSPRPLKVLVALLGERRPTRETVAALKDRIARWPLRYGRLLAQVGALADDGAKAVAAGDLEALGDAMNANQGLLGALGLSSLPIERMVYRLRGLGALGAKLTGAGGDGGAVVGLFLEPEPAVARLRQAGVRCFASQLAGPPAL